ncbi:CBS domain-containing protein [Parasulfuritortus cantonensis]|uniref:CBS domain-containing protein n=1 Tax=Parasulfuritortus cantonensis TaxID=2528202 RepID=A0A4R1B9L4_9PROT|nr:CBS domain-containing protein [Parasulfuritortus cantonensis]TCJ13611.1 CBS domain-containing protein [Parasulfuritortus cantonensis]
METTYRMLPVAPLQKGATFVKPRQQVIEAVTMEQSATAVMTDFAVVTAQTILPLESIEAARTKMIHHGVRLLLVTDDQQQILGLITASDLTSERPMRVIQTQGIRHADVLVKDIMTPREKLEVICMDDLQKAKVGDVVSTLQAKGRQHALVVERQADRSQILRGMFSTTQIARQLDMPIHTVPVADSFAEIAQLND